MTIGSTLDSWLEDGAIEDVGSFWSPWKESSDLWDGYMQPTCRPRGYPFLQD